MIFAFATVALILLGAGVIWAEAGSRLQTFLWLVWFVALVNWFAILVAEWTQELR